MDNNLNSCREQADLKPWGQSRVAVSPWINILSGQIAGLWGLSSSSIRCPSGSRCKWCTCPGEFAKFLGLFLYPDMLLICPRIHIVPAYQFISVNACTFWKKISLCFLGGAGPSLGGVHYGIWSNLDCICAQTQSTCCL